MGNDIERDDERLRSTAGSETLYNAMISMGQAVFEAGAQPEPAILLMAYNAIVAICVADQGADDQLRRYERQSQQGLTRFAQVQDVILRGGR